MTVKDIDKTNAKNRVNPLFSKCEVLWISLVKQRLRD